MGRDHTKLEVFQMADELVLGIYRLSAELPARERYGLRTLLRRTAVGTASTLVEGSTRRTTRDYLHYVTMSLGSASEVRYLLSVARRLELVPKDDAQALENRYDRLVRGLQRLVTVLRTANHNERRARVRPKPAVRSPQPVGA